MADGTLINAHQPTISLLRRPRPPKVLAASHHLDSGLLKHHQSTTSPQKSPRNCQTSPQHTLTQHYTHDVYANTKAEFPIYSLYPKGPSLFPPGKILMRNRHIASPAIDTHIPQGLDGDNSPETCNNRYTTLPDSDFEFLDESAGSDYYQTNTGFALEDFQMSTEVSPQRRILCEQGVKVISRQNYLKLTGWFANNVPTQESLNTVDLDVGLQSPQERKPRHQALLELRSMVDEILMVSSSSITIESEDPIQQASPPLDPPDHVIRNSMSRYFCGQGRSNSPFDSSDQPQITPSEVAILDCMMTGGARLSLKAHFISECPDLSPLTMTLTYVNVSFNCLNVFPPELLQLPHLLCLQMRNNPIKEIPNEIRNLTKLRVLCVSFNLLSELPSGLFELRSLHNLDVSYNTLHTLSRNISMLVNLRKLNVEGNQLAGLPSTCMSLPLTHLLVGDNLMHPILWRENTRNQPQELVDLCSLVVSKCVSSTSDPRLPGEIVSTLQSHTPQVCDNCQCPLYGCGLRVIRAVSEDVFGIRNLPFLFQVCSPSCRTMLKRRSNTEWTQPFHASS